MQYSTYYIAKAGKEQARTGPRHEGGERVFASGDLCNYIYMGISRNYSSWPLNLVDTFWVNSLLYCMIFTTWDHKY